jgi:hypothetical protein
MNLVRWQLLLRTLAILCAVLIAPGDTIFFAQAQQAQPPADTLLPRSKWTAWWHPSRFTRISSWGKC